VIWLYDEEWNLSIYYIMIAIGKMEIFFRSDVVQLFSGPFLYPDSSLVRRRFVVRVC